MHAIDYSSQAEILRAINTIPVLAGIGIHEQHILADKCSFEEQDSNHIMIEQGAAADKLYFIIKGTVLVCTRASSYGWNRVDTLGPGDVFGEIAILRDISRTARIITLEYCVFLTISAHDFLKVYQYFPAKSRDNIQLVVAKRLQQLRK